MRMQITRVFVGFLMVSMFSVLSVSAQVPDETRRIEVSPKSLNCYGNWEGNVVVLERFGTEVFANGWRVHRLLPAQQPVKRVKKVETRPWLLLEKSVWKERDRLLKEGRDDDYIADACIDMLLASHLVETAVHEGTSIAIKRRFEDGVIRSGFLELYVYKMDPARKAQLELEDAQAFFNRIASSLENGDLVIFASHVLGETIQIPAAHRGRRELQEALDEIEHSKGKKSAYWPYPGVFSAGTAEQMRNPMPVTRKERR